LQTCYKDCHHFGCNQRINPSIMQGKATLLFYGTRTQTQRERDRERQSSGCAHTCEDCWRWRRLSWRLESHKKRSSWPSVRPCSSVSNVVI
jgi:hypothetical protein